MLRKILTIFRKNKKMLITILLLSISFLLINLLIIFSFYNSIRNDKGNSNFFGGSNPDTIDVDSVISVDTISLPETEKIITQNNNSVSEIKKEDTIVITDNDTINKIPISNTNKIIVSVTCYQPLKEQCSGNPLITADGSHINLNDLYNNKIKWCAVSPDIINNYYKSHKKGKPKYIHIDGFGIYEIHDRTSSRFRNRVDILIHPQHKVFGRKNNVKATIIK